uniref:Uncharacterized protein n=1 Tax=Aegilops tauschii TaxID=37682 RepID=N1QQV8_AEGTA
MAIAVSSLTSGSLAPYSPEVSRQRRGSLVSASPRRRQAVAGIAIKSRGINRVQPTTRGATQIPAAAAGSSSSGDRPGGNFPVPNVPSCYEFLRVKLLVGVFFAAVPLYRQMRALEDKVEQTAEVAIEVVEKVAEAAEKIADDVSEAFPGNDNLKKAASRIKAVADEIEKDAEKAEALIEKVDEIEKEMDSVVDSVIEKVKKERSLRKNSMVWHSICSLSYDFSIRTTMYKNSPHIACSSDFSGVLVACIGGDRDVKVEVLPLSIRAVAIILPTCTFIVNVFPAAPISVAAHIDTCNTTLSLGGSPYYCSASYNVTQIISPSAFSCIARPESMLFGPFSFAFRVHSFHTLFAFHVLLKNRGRITFTDWPVNFNHLHTSICPNCIVRSSPPANPNRLNHEVLGHQLYRSTDADKRSNTLVPVLENCQKKNHQYPTKRLQLVQTLGNYQENPRCPTNLHCEYRKLYELLRVTVVVGGVFGAVSFYGQMRAMEENVEKTAEVAIETIEKAADVVDKLADEVIAFPGNENLKKAAFRIKAIAEEIEKDAEEAEALIHKVRLIAYERLTSLFVFSLSAFFSCVKYASLVCRKSEKKKRASLENPNKHIQIKVEPLENVEEIEKEVDAAVDTFMGKGMKKGSR